MAGAMRRMGIYLGLVEDDDAHAYGRYDDRPGEGGPYDERAERRPVRGARYADDYADERYDDRYADERHPADRGADRAPDGYGARAADGYGDERHPDDRYAERYADERYAERYPDDRHAEGYGAAPAPLRPRLDSYDDELPVAAPRRVVARPLGLAPSVGGAPAGERGVLAGSAGRGATASGLGGPVGPAGPGPVGLGGGSPLAGGVSSGPGRGGGPAAAAGLAVREQAPEPAPAPVPAPAPAPPRDAYRITTVHPSTYNDARTIGEAYRDGRPVIMNLTDLDDADAKRLVDFAAGLIFGLRGSIERVTAKVFLLTPQDVDVTAEDKARIREGEFPDQS